MFGTNEIIGKKYFKETPVDSLFVTSMFFTLQGEGPYAGLPAVFIRLTKCNLTCSFCDTFFDDGEWMTFDEIKQKVGDTIYAYWESKGGVTPIWAHPNKQDFRFPNIVLVMTGGEPLLQDNISKFMTNMLPAFKAVQVESNGLPNTDVPAGVTLVCSPKCMEKDGVATKYYAPSKTILDRADCLKFVMSADTTSPYNEVPEWAHEWKRQTGKEIYCSPMNIYNTFPQKIKLLRAEKGTITMAERSTVDEKINFFEPGLLNMEEIAKNHEYVGKYCMDHGFKMNMQMHLFANLA
jgi:organic radical activating enzyme